MKLLGRRPILSPRTRLLLGDVMANAAAAEKSWTFRPDVLEPPDTGNSLQVHVVGCGGAGARVVGPLLQSLPRAHREGGAIVHLWDGDVVETRNLLRQNFCADDVGCNKAEVLAERYTTMDGVKLAAHPKMLLPEDFPILNHPGPSLILGCTDSLAFRQQMVAWLCALPPHLRLLLIDGGNERYTGQVIMEGWWVGLIYNLIPSRGPLRTNDMSLEIWQMCARQALRHALDPENYPTTDPCYFAGFSTHFPDLLTRTEVEGPTCAVRVDLQTVAVNQMSAAWQLAIVGHLLAGTPFGHMGVQFSTTGVAKPLPLPAPHFMLYPNSDEYFIEVSSSWPARYTEPAQALQYDLNTNLITTQHD